MVLVTITAPIRDNKAATSTPVNIAVVHATQSARGDTMRTRPKMVRRILGTVHITTVLLALLIQAMIK
ncbi:uncharacterized protein METZ01_LOCUS177743 [marine metagenome]|uniref:Uncharacterized protein n=1 Tax=marine metagenome TaxID=408172 RepID=A0A382CGB3_9ZZZZ